MKASPLVSVIVPTKNEEKNISRCLRSIINQQYEGAVEIIVVDNHSTDKTVEIVKKFTPHVLISGKERSEQRNIGAKNAKGPWLLFVDADMELTAGVIKECIALTKNRVVAPIIVIDEKAIGYSLLSKAFALEKNCYEHASWLQAARFFPRKYFMRLGGYDETLVAGEDWDLTQRFRMEEGFPIFITTKTHLIHHESKEKLKDLYKKEIYYITHIDRYAKKHPIAFSYQGSFLYRIFIYIRNWDRLLKHPFLAFVFLSFKLSVWILYSVEIKKNKLKLSE